MNLFINCALLLIFMFLPMSLHPTKTYPLLNVPPPSPDDIPPVLPAEVDRALKSMNFSKSPGEDGITTEALKIERIECDLPMLPNGMVRLKLRSKIAKFSCRGLYTLVGHRYSACTSSGHWDEQIPVCVKPGCPSIQQTNSMRVYEAHQGAWLLFFCLPEHKLVGSPVLYCDGNKWNGTAPTCEASEAPPRLKCDFESSDLCGWRQDDLHDFDWLQWSSKTPSFYLKTGPLFDHTMGSEGFGKYMYIESTGRNMNSTGRILSPFYPAKMTDDGCFSFFYHMYGRTVGGLRVYQKPVTLELSDLINDSEASKKYMLFEKWGNQGDYWYRNVSRLKKSDKDFQIVIEGIMGQTYSGAGDVAIDDVDLLQGNACNLATIESFTPPSRYNSESCETGCGFPGYERDCYCNVTCLAKGNCCTDFFDICFGSDDSSPAYFTLETTEPESVEKPQTQKLTAAKTTEQTTITSTTASKPLTTLRSITTKSTPRSTTLPSTTSRSTTKKPKPTLVFKTSTKVYKATPLNKDGIVNIEPSTTKKVVLTTPKSTTKIVSTTESHGVSRTLENHNEYHELVEKARQDKRVSPSVRSRDAEKASSNASTIVIILLIVVSASVVAGVVALRSGRGQAALSKWTRRQSDQEVRYLTSSVDEDD